MAHTYTRTVTVVPADDGYTWSNPATGWIVITQVGSSDTWNIEVLDNTTNQSRSATLTVNHTDGSTTNSITVNQAAGASGGVTPTPTPSSSTPGPTPTPSSSTPGPTPTPSPSSSNSVNPTFIFASGTTSSNRDVMGINDNYLDVAYTITNDGLTSPIAPSAVSASSTGGWITGANLSGPTGSQWDPLVFTGVYRFTKQQSGNSTQYVNCSVGGPYGTTEIWYVQMTFGTGTSNDKGA